MSAAEVSQPVGDDEDIARFVVQSNYVRGRNTSNPSVKAGAFIPPLNLELSVTRHAGMEDERLWAIGRGIATGQGKTLYGRADIRARDVRTVAREIEAARHLQIVPSEPPPNHANITGWPDDKPAHMLIAQELALLARFAATPTQ